MNNSITKKVLYLSNLITHAIVMLFSLVMLYFTKNVDGEEGLGYFFIAIIAPIFAFPLLIIITLICFNLLKKIFKLPNISKRQIIIVTVLFSLFLSYAPYIFVIIVSTIYTILYHYTVS
jgi:hypothetical protein